MGKIFKLPSPSQGEIFTYVFLSDIHSVHSDPAALDAAIKFISLIPIRQRKVILGGDILDISFIYKTNEAYKKALFSKDWDGYFIPELQIELDWWESFINRIKRFCPFNDSVFFMSGNHESRLSRPQFIDEVPHAYRHNFDLKSILKLEKRGIQFIEHNDFFRLEANKSPACMITHGIYCGANPIAKHVLKETFTSTIFGHVHSIGLQSFKSSTSTIYGISNGCLCYIDKERQPEYLDNKSHDWTQGFTVVNQTVDYLSYSIVPIYDGQIFMSTGEILSNY